MQKLLGLIIIFVCVIGGFIMSGGRLASFWQPGEIVIILGAGLGAMVLANPKHVLIEMWHQFRGVLRKKEYTDEYQRQLLMLLYELLELVQDGGLKVLDEHIEVPESSSLFQKYPLILRDKDLVTFISDNFRLMAMGKLTNTNWRGSLSKSWEQWKKSFYYLLVRCSVLQKRCRGLASARRCWGLSLPCSLSMALSPLSVLRWPRR